MSGLDFTMSKRRYVLLSVAVVAVAVVCFVRRNDYFGYLGRNYILQNDLTDLELLVTNRPDVATDLLEVAFKESNQDAYTLLLRAGAEPSKSWIRSRWGSESLLHKAAERQNTFWLEEALKHGADPNQHNNPNRVYPLTYAIQSRLPENAFLLIQYNADVDANAGRAQSMVSFAWSQGQYSVALRLLEKGAAVNPPNLVSKSLVSRMLFSLQDIQREMTLGNAKKSGSLPHLEKILAWFDEQRLDWRNATYDESIGNVPKTWHIPRLPDSEPDAGDEK